MILIFTEKLTPRMNYVFHQILRGVLGLELEFTSKIENFIAYKGLKFSYGKSKMGNEIFVKEFGILSQQGINEADINVEDWNGVACFFGVGDDSDIPFDIFSASFYLLSRYEEYLPHVKDDVGRYQPQDSLAFRHKFLRQPVVDIWAYRFKKILQKQFPDANFPERKFKVRNILSVAELYKYRKKGLMRNFGGGIWDLFKLRIKDLYIRFKTLLYLKKDPYDVYRELLQFSKQHRISWNYMFQLSDYSIHNKNLGYNKLTYHAMIKSMGDYGKIGLLLGYEALSDIKILRKEKKRWESIVNQDLEMAMVNDYGLNLPDLYNNYDSLEIEKDFSMGYVDRIGFRAGTCTPFLYYDINLERISPLVLYPTAFNSKVLSRASFFEVKTGVEQLIKNVKEVDGQLQVAFKNYDFAEGENHEKVYQLLEIINDYE